MAKDDQAAMFDWLTKTMFIPFTGILGTGSMLGLKHALVRSEGTGRLFYATVAALGVAALAGLALRVRSHWSGEKRLEGPVGVVMLLGFIAGLIGCTILCTLRNW